MKDTKGDELSVSQVVRVNDKYGVFIGSNRVSMFAGLPEVIEETDEYVIEKRYKEKIVEIANTDKVFGLNFMSASND